MRLWTIQPEEIWEILNNTGRFICDQTKSIKIQDGSRSKRAYQWLMQQMQLKIGTPLCGPMYPIWAWHTYDGKHHQPDLRLSGYGKRGTKCVCLELEIADNRVVLSDFDTWSHVLHNSLLDNSKYEQERRLTREWYNNLDTETQNKIKLESWQRIFNTEYIENDWTSVGKYVQATFWELFITDVKKVKHFVAR